MMAEIQSMLGKKVTNDAKPVLEKKISLVQYSIPRTIPSSIPLFAYAPFSFTFVSVWGLSLNRLRSDQDRPITLTNCLCYEEKKAVRCSWELAGHRSGVRLGKN